MSLVSHGVGDHGESQINNPRRAALLESFVQDAALDRGYAAALRHNHASLPGTPLAANFPALSKLQAAGYTCVEDLDGANEDELIKYVPGITWNEANAAIAAWNALGIA